MRRRPSPFHVLVAVVAAGTLASSAAIGLAAGGDDPSPVPGASSGSGTASSMPPLPGPELGGQQISGDMRVFGYAYDTGDDIAKVRVDRFRELYPDVNVSFSESGWDEQQFLAALAGSAPPDMVNIPRNILGTYVAKGVLQPLDGCVASVGADMSVFRKPAMDQLTVDGQVYGWPQFYNTRVWLIDDDAWAAAGLDPDSFDFSDWDAIADASSKLAKVDGGSFSAIGIDPKMPEFLPLWAHANGVDLVSADGRTSQLDDPRVAEALTFARDLIRSQGDPSAFLDFRGTWDFFGAGNELATHQVGAFPMEQWYLNVLAENSPDVHITAKPFMTRDGQPMTWEDGDALAIVTGAANPEAACEFGHVVTAAPTWIAAAQVRADKAAAEGKPQTGVYSGNSDADAYIFANLVDLSAMPVFRDAVQVVLDTQDSAFGLPPTPAAAEVDQEFRSAVAEVLGGGTDAAVALGAADQRAQDAIDGAGGR